ncbi:MAG: DUF5063 domain-containing protein [Nitrospirota bacterium]|nr:DUF5063 domain-containing protein [Nitrospirota bacterium]
MDGIQIKESIESFLSFVKDQKPHDSPLEDLKTLSDHLYEILMQGRRIQDKDVETSVEDVEPEKWPYKKRREICTARFSILGMYNLPEHITHQIGETNWLIGDAIDDLADIIGDLQEVLWFYEKAYSNVALWHFSFKYRSHWGYHAENLLWYLHALQREVE